MKKVLDEEVFLEGILSDGFSRDNNPVFHELLVLAKHFRQKDGFGQKNIVKALISFCKDRNEFFNPVVERDRLKKVARVAIKNPKFSKPNYPLYFSKRELENIRKVRNFKYQKIIFSALAFSKSFGNPSIFSQSEKDIRAILTISGERCTTPEFISKVSPLAFRHGIFEHVIYKRRGGFYRLLVDGDSDDGVGTSISTMDELENAGEFYRRFIGGDLEWCSKCEKEFVKSGKNHSYCETCAADRAKERNRNRRSKV